MERRSGPRWDERSLMMRSAAGRSGDSVQASIGEGRGPRPAGTVACSAAIGRLVQHDLDSPRRATAPKRASGSARSPQPAGPRLGGWAFSVPGRSQPLQQIEAAEVFDVTQGHVPTIWGEIDAVYPADASHIRRRNGPFLGGLLAMNVVTNDVRYLCLGPPYPELDLPPKQSVEREGL